MPPAITIVIAEDRDYLLDAFCRIIKNEPGLELLAAVTNGRELIQKVALKPPDIIITDLKMPEMDGIEACRLLEASHPQVRKIVITMYNDYCLNLQLLKCGVRGFLLKNTSAAEVIECIRKVHAGGMYCHEGAASLISGKWKDEEEPTEFELEVLHRMFMQQDTKTMATESFKSEAAVSLARSELKRKANAKNDFGIAMWAVVRGYVKVGEF